MKIALLTVVVPRASQIISAAPNNGITISPCRRDGFSTAC
jgi:hypothetical protein